METIETVDLKHHDCLTERFHQMNLQISDYTFANVYLFRKISHYEFLTTYCGLFIFGRQGCFFPIPEEWLSFFPADKFVINCDDSESDYIYLTEKMANFKGRQYTRHRNHLNQFL